MSKTINSKPFDIHSQEKDVVTMRDYTGDRSQLAYKRTAPKRVKDFPGMSKSETKYTLTDVVGSLVGIVTVSTSVRADATTADKVDLMVTSRSAIADASWEQLVTDQRLPFLV